MQSRDSDAEVGDEVSEELAYHRSLLDSLQRWVIKRELLLASGLLPFTHEEEAHFNASIHDEIRKRQEIVTEIEFRGSK